MTIDLVPMLRAFGIGISYTLAALYVGNATTQLKAILRKHETPRRKMTPGMLGLLFLCLGFVVLASMAMSLEGLGANVALQLPVASALLLGAATAAVLAFFCERLIERTDAADQGSRQAGVPKG